MTNKNIKLQVWKNNSETAVATQGEVNSRFLTVKIEDENGPIDLTNKKVYFFAKKPDNNPVFVEMSVEDAENGTAVLGLTSQMSAVSGFLTGCEIHVMSANGNTLIVKEINMIVQPSLGILIEESLSELSAFQQMITDVDALKQHSINEENPHNVTIAQIGAASTDVATTSVNGLMSSADKSKLNGIAAGAEVNVQSDWNQTDSTSDDYIKNKPSIPSSLTDLIGTLPVGNGGTGATNVSDAWANMQIYTAVEQLELSYPCTAVEICNAMPNKSIFITNIEDKQLTVTDVPVSWGMLNIIKISNSRKELEFARAMNTDCTRYIGGYSSGDTTVTWKSIPYGIISINQGGTGANTKTSARNALGAASSDDVGNVSNLSTSSKTIVGAINELYQAIQSL